MLRVNLWDIEFAHSIAQDGFDSCSHLVKPTKIEYVRNQMEWDGITLFTNNCLDMVDKVKSKVKIAWPVEARAITPQLYDKLIELEDKFDYILTWYQDLLDRNPAKYKKVFVGSSRILPPFQNIYNKTKVCSLLTSFKTITEPHRFRLILAQQLHQQKTPIDIFGSNYLPFATKVEPHKDYMFSIVIMNSCEDYYFTEYLIDCFLCGTIPVFYGCPKIGDVFNIDGILHFTEYHQINNLFQFITPDYYYSKMAAIIDNFERAKKFISTDDIVADTILKLPNIN
jgi:hypothetical protein